MVKLNVCQVTDNFPATFELCQKTPEPPPPLPLWKGSSSPMSGTSVTFSKVGYSDPLPLPLLLIDSSFTFASLRCWWHFKSNWRGALAPPLSEPEGSRARERARARERERERGRVSWTGTPNRSILYLCVSPQALLTD